MREALEEFLVVFSHSTKTQLALLFGLGFFLGTMAVGNYFTNHVELHELLAPLTDVIRKKIAHRYDKIAWAIFFGFLFLAVRCYKKDRKRLFGF
jgi:zinc transporter ZupT